LGNKYGGTKHQGRTFMVADRCHKKKIKNINLKLKNVLKTKSFQHRIDLKLKNKNYRIIFSEQNESKLYLN
jgi:hypothetical protein